MTRLRLFLSMLTLCGCSEVLGIEPGAEKAAMCDTEGLQVCEGLTPKTCSQQRWESAKPCRYLCQDGACSETEPRSCSKLTPCADGASCCEISWVPGGDFLLRYDAREYATGFPRTVSGFFLDRFEVTVIRFRQFVEAYPRSLPAGDGIGAPVSLPQMGWRDAWKEIRDPNDELAIPETREALEELLNTCAGSTFANFDDTLPINCVNWYLAFAFCAWDGGRLPTETEWQFAAAHGDEQRVYPWSSPPHHEVIDDTRAWFNNLEEPGWVGMKPAGRGGYNHDDLAGNVLEWVLDGDGPPDEAPCADCATDWNTASRVLRGGHFADMSRELKNANSSAAAPESYSVRRGFRCARDSRTRKDADPE